MSEEPQVSANLGGGAFTRLKRLVQGRAAAVASIRAPLRPHALNYTKPVSVFVVKC